MASARNQVIAGDYDGKYVFPSNFLLNHPTIGTFSNIEISSKTVKAYELLTDEHRKSAASGVARGLVSGVLLGPVGLLAGALSAKNKSIYHVAIQFNDGKSCLIEIDNNIYKALIKSCFGIESMIDNITIIDSNRLYYSPVYDDISYINLNEDIRTTFGNNITEAFNHFISYGINEGCIAHRDFDVRIYKSKNTDLEKAFGNKWKEYYIHYIEHGQFEGRECKMQYNEYELISSSAKNSSYISIADEIAKYKELLDNGAITIDEYESLKSKLIESM